MNTQTEPRSAARRGLLSILCAALLWGTVGVVTKAIYETSETNALSIGFFRLAIATPVLLMACWRALGRRAFCIARRDLALMLGIGAAMAATVAPHDSCCHGVSGAPAAWRAAK